jgi:hydrogenase maturation factor
MCLVLPRRINKIRGKRNVEARVEIVVCKKWSNSYRRMQRVVVDEFGKWEKVNVAIV